MYHIDNTFVSKTRSHSEEPKHEEVYPLRPRSASENNVAPCVDSKGKPSIIIFSSGSSQNVKADEQSSSSATTSSSDRSPVAGIVENKGETFIDQLKKKRLQELHPDDNEIDDGRDVNSPLDGDDGRQFRGNEVQVDSCRTQSCLAKSKCEGKSSLLRTLGVEDIGPSIHLKLPSERPDVDGGSDGGEESGMGDFEGPTTDTDSWNVKKTSRRSWCSCSCGKVKISAQLFVKVRTILFLASWFGILTLLLCNTSYYPTSPPLFCITLQCFI